MCTLWLNVACVALATAAGPAGDNAVLDKVDRQIARQPSYTAKQPLFGLLVFGPEAGSRVWLVLDKSQPDANRYDVLYADLNGNGDLTEPSERLVARTDGTGQPPAVGADVGFRLPDFTDPATGATHTAFSLRASGELSPTVMLSLKWRDRYKMGGGYPEESEAGYLEFADTPAAAPIVWANGDGPFRFQRWYSGKLSIGAADDLKLFVGQRGRGAGSFCAFQEHYLPDSEGVQATLMYRDGQDAQQRAVCLLKERC